MKKSQVKTASIDNLEFKWSPLNAEKINVREKNDILPRRLEEYFDFLEDIAPVSPDNSPVKIYSERFSL